MGKRSSGKIKNDRKVALTKNSLFILLSVVLLILCAITWAWFSMNKQVEHNFGELNTQSQDRFSVATLSTDSQGAFDNGTSSDSLITQLKTFLRHNEPDLDLSTITSFENLPEYVIGSDTVTASDSKTYIIGNQDNVSLLLNKSNNFNNLESDSTLSPGSKGKFTFYIIPHIDDLGPVDIEVSLNICKAERDGSTGNITRINLNEMVDGKLVNEKLGKIVSGHILFFRTMIDGNYSGRITTSFNSEGNVSFTISDFSPNGGFQNKTAYPITIYWIWPHRFENIVYTGQDESVFSAKTTDYTQLLSWVNNNRDCIVNFTENLSTLDTPSDTMSNSALVRWNFGYNRGDQLIGDNIAFFNLTISAVE